MSDINSSEKIPSLFVTPRAALAVGGGGVQICTREYITTLKAGGFDLETIPFDLDSRFRTRILNKLFPGYYPRQLPPDLRDQLLSRSVQRSIHYVFFNFSVYPSLTRWLRARFGTNVKMVLLSHGLESTDYCVAQQFQNGYSTMRIPSGKARQLGGKILHESKGRQGLDGVLCLSSFDADLERWLGTRHAMWVPRVILEQPLIPEPVDRRVGCVGTLDHPPNRHGLLQLFNELARLEVQNLHFCIVGGPEKEGRVMAAQFKFVDYLGPLDDAKLRTEARTWCCFVHPLFVSAKGCSTKLAVALGWGLPIATTVAGVRGYCWEESVLPPANSPHQLAQFVRIRSDITSFERLRSETLKIAQQTPSVNTVAQRIRQFVDNLGTD